MRARSLLLSSVLAVTVVSCASSAGVSTQSASELRPGEQAALDAIDLQDLPHRAVAPAWLQGVNDRARNNMLAAT